jgi:hypothetical protein
MDAIIGARPELARAKRVLFTGLSAGAWGLAMFCDGTD